MSATPAASMPATGDGGRLSILHVVDTLEFGGLERVVADLSSAQRAHGHAVSVFSLTGAGDLGPSLKDAGVQVLEGGKRHGLDLALLSRLRRAASGMQADIVHTHNFVPNYYAALALMTIARRRPVLVNTCHNMGSRLAGARLRRLYRLSLARTARVAGVGTGVADHLVAMGLVPRARIDAVRNGVHMPPVPDTPARARGRAALGLDDDAIVVGCVGRLVALKNHRLLLDQVPALALAFPRLQVVLVGDGPMRDELQAHAAALGIEARVHFTGARSDVDRLLPALDVFVLPSRTEGLSIALLEACAQALPIVASRVGGNPEIVRHGSTGLLFDSDDGDALRASLRCLLTDDVLRRALGDAARAWVDTHASMPALRAGYDAFYAKARSREPEPGAQRAVPTHARHD